MKTRIKTGLYFWAACFLLTAVPAVAQTYLRDINYNGNDVTANEEVKCITELQYQPTAANNGKKIIGGSFSYYDGVYSSFIARVNQDGTIDNTFKSPGAFSGAVFCVAEGRDGKLYVGGAFTKIGDKTIRGIVRLNSDGSIDDSFDTGGGFNGNSGPNAIPEVWSILLKDDPVLDAADAGILVGGAFKRFNGNLIEGAGDEGGLVQLNFNGSFNRSFRVNDDCCTGGGVYDMAFDNNGQIVIGGEFGSVAGTTARRLARLNRRGGFAGTPILDPTYANNSFPQSAVYTVTIQPDNKILVGGAFTSFLNYSWGTIAGTGGYIARMNADGTLDIPGDADAEADFVVGTGFTISYTVPFPGVRAIEVDALGRIWVGGDVNSYNTTDTYNMVRLNSDGTLDNTFDIGTGFNSTVWDILVKPVTYTDHGTTLTDPAGAVYVAGRFTTFNSSTSKGNFIKMASTSPLATTNLQFRAVKLANNTVKLEWNDAGAVLYELQRSVDGVHFVTIYTATNTGPVAGFSYVDKTAPATTLYYRMVYKEVGGHRQTSIVYKLTLAAKPEAKVYAVSANELKLLYTGQSRTVAKVVVQAVSLSGRTLYQQNIPVTSNHLQTTLYLASPLETCFLLVKDEKGSLLYKGYWSQLK